MTIKDYAITALKGVLLGLISVGIPGLSASTIGIIVGIYFLMVESISGIFKKPKKSIPFLAFLILGYSVGAIGAAFSVKVLFENFPLVVTLAICGIIIGCIPQEFAKLKGTFHKASCSITFAVVVIVLAVYNLLLNSGENAVVFPTEPSILYLIEMFVIGLVTSATFIIPGVDFAAVFLSLGMYYPFMTMIADIFTIGSPNYGTYILGYVEILGFYLVGYLIGVFLFSKLIKTLMKKFQSQVLYAALAFVCASPFIVVKNCVFDNAAFTYSTSHLVIGVILAIVFMAGMLLLSFKGAAIVKERESARDAKKMQNETEAVVDHE